MAWTSSLFDCFSDMRICLYGWCCTPCLYGENAEKIDGSNPCGHCLLYCCALECGICCLVHMEKRRMLRQRFGLKEDSLCGDCLATTFCSECAICQEARELKARAVTQEPKIVTMQPGVMTTPTVVMQPNMVWLPATNGNMYTVAQQYDPSIAKVIPPAYSNCMPMRT